MEKKSEERLRMARKDWEESCLNPVLKRFGLERGQGLYTPLDIKEGWDFLEKVGFPGQYPYTSGVYPCSPEFEPTKGGGYQDVAPGMVRAGRYSGYGTAEDTREYYRHMLSIGQRTGPNFAFDLPTQCGYDSDDPRAEGEVGRTGVAIDTLRDFETVYEAFTGDMDLDRIASNWTINCSTNVILAMYIALAEKRGIPQEKLRGTPQNDPLKEFVARGTYIFPVRHQMRMLRDSAVYCVKHMPRMNWMSCGAGHLRQAGATGVQSGGITLSNALEYVKLATNAGLDVDDALRQFTFFIPIGCGMEFFHEIALCRAVRRMWAKIARDQLGAKNPRSWMMRNHIWAMQPLHLLTKQRPLNNHTRGVITGIAAALAGGTPNSGMGMPYDEALGLGHSEEGWQLHLDAARVIQYETDVCDVIDPLAGSYYMESLTDQAEEEMWEVMRQIEARGGAAAAVEDGFISQMLARSAYEFQRDIENRRRVWVGVNAFTGEHELEVLTTRVVPQPYDEAKWEAAEEKQKASLAKVKRDRDNAQVEACLKRLKDAARDESVNLMPVIVEAVKAYASIGEICGVLRELWGEYRGYKAI